jgi:hypothetical protein
LSFAENDELYNKSLPENAEGIAEITIARAAKELWKLCKIKNEVPAVEQAAEFDLAYRNFLDFEKTISKMNEFFWLVKGFVQVMQGMTEDIIKRQH